MICVMAMDMMYFLEKKTNVQVGWFIIVVAGCGQKFLDLRRDHGRINLSVVFPVNSCMACHTLHKSTGIRDDQVTAMYNMAFLID